MHVGRNDPCPCNSGKKFKKCCIGKASLISQGYKFVPYLKLPFSISLALTVQPIAESTPWFAPILCIGGTWEACNFKATSEKPNSDQILRFGFCNRELRPILQFQTTKGLFEVAANDVIKPGYLAFDINLDNATNSMNVYVNGKLLMKGPLEGQIDFNRHENVVYGFGPGFAMWCVQVQRYLLSDQKIDQLSVAIPEDLSQWNEYLNGYDRIIHLGEDRHIAYQFISKYTLHRMNPKLRIVRSILNATGKSETDYANDGLAIADATNTIRQITSKLRSLIDSDTTKEPEILNFFRDTPAASILLEPDSVKQFREDEIQHYGKIDFVFEIYDGTIRVVEIESPKTGIFVKTDEFSQPMQHALSQVTTWIRGAKKTPQHFNIRHKSQEPVAFLGMSVIGRRDQISNPHRRERWGEIQTTVRCLTWDDIVSRGETLARKLQNPSVTEINWD
jgi:Domain of unknown function (DUF4263)/SEC-C motif